MKSKTWRVGGCPTCAASRASPQPSRTPLAVSALQACASRNAPTTRPRPSRTPLAVPALQACASRDAPPARRPTRTTPHPHDAPPARRPTRPACTTPPCCRFGAKRSASPGPTIRGPGGYPRSAKRPPKTQESQDVSALAPETEGLPPTVLVALRRADRRCSPPPY